MKIDRKLNIQQDIEALYAGKNVAGKFRQPKKRDWLKIISISWLVVLAVSWLGFWLWFRTLIN